MSPSAVPSGVSTDAPSIMIGSSPRPQLCCTARRYIYIYIYIYMCVCVCVDGSEICTPQYANCT